MVRAEPTNTRTTGTDTTQLCSRYYENSTLYVGKGGYSSNGKIVSAELLSLMVKLHCPLANL